MKSNPSPRESAFFMAIAILLMVVIKMFVMGEHRYVKDLRQNMKSEIVIAHQSFEGPEGNPDLIQDNIGDVDIHISDLPHTPVLDDNMSPIDPLYMAYEEYRAKLDKEHKAKENIERKSNSADNAQPEKTIAKRKIVPLYPKTPGKGKVVIIIDDLGMNRKQSIAMVAIKQAPLTLAFLPYAPKLETITEDARRNGHELMIHTPMEPMGKSDPGPMALMDYMTREQLETNLSHIFQSFKGYKGINNHMGSRLTQNTAAMNVIMAQLAKRGLYFVDSKTIANSVAGQAAANYGVRFAERHVFLDHEESPEFVAKALAKLERVAKKQGVAIAIGHPKKNTVAALKAWLPTLQSRGLELVPASEVVYRQPRSVGAIATNDGNDSSSAASMTSGVDVSRQLLLTLPQIEPATY